jgi:hypothetical protein
VTDTTPDERARRAHSLFLRRIADHNQGDIAKAMGIQPSKLSDLKKNDIEACLLVLAHVGLKVVPNEYVCMSKDAHTFLTASHARIVKTAPQLLWGEDE